MFKRSFGIIMIVALAAGFGLLAAHRLLGPAPASGYPDTRAVTLYPQARTLPPFSLRQSDGTPLVNGELNGHWTLVFLGFTACPDVCPTVLADMAQAQKAWESLPETLRPRVLFVSVDPDRDTPRKVGEYAHGFHRDTLAATADVPALENFATSLLSVFQKVPGPHFDENPSDYSMDHSSTISVLDPQGRLAGLIRPPLDPKAIAADMVALTEAGAKP